MAGEIVGLAAEERRRRWTVVALGSALFVSTVPITNERALFSPLGDIAILGNLSPVAYAVTFGNGGGPGGNRGVPVRGGGVNRPPVAFAARVPPVFASPPGVTTPAVPSSSSFVPATPGSVLPGAPGAGGPPTSGGPSGGSGLPGGGGGGGGGGLPPSTPNPTPPVPEPATWVTLIFGFGVIGGLMRRSRRLRGPIRSQPIPIEC